jgi:acyl-CoA reductase-like NAD-dependent aldehyde dehydrogenase
MSGANVAGVDVDTRHWIGGRRVASDRTFTDLSPIDEKPLAEVARGGAAEVDAAVRAAGNTVVAKPPEWAPLTASLLADITAAAGLPDGVFNVVQGLGAEAGAPLAAHPDLARVCFTGSVATGRLVAAAAGAQLTPASLELGGKSPFLVFADADLDLAVQHAVGQYDNAGQVCLAGTRLLVEAPVAEEFIKRFTERAQALRQGDPRAVRRGRPVGHRPRGRHLELRLLRRREEHRLRTGRMVPWVKWQGPGSSRTCRRSCCPAPSGSS